jgi:hypothetical protein
MYICIIYTLSNGTVHDMEEGGYPTFVHATHIRGRPERLTLRHKKGSIMMHSYCCKRGN